ncbi:PREDICTED: uncharacterized protein LOC102013981 [Chinchilla lanigera]|uniref:uncharacterized protein LOC102013981 n=1 Tax=Chinchilla lanigera TaxID=34839 RepID=UPI0006980B9E|nr:PREDICTED: uncharacterized protein LOC102013981 [Chinchilla lanigera]
MARAASYQYVCQEPNGQDMTVVRPGSPCHKRHRPGQGCAHGPPGDRGLGSAQSGVHGSRTAGRSVPNAGGSSSGPSRLPSVLQPVAPDPHYQTPPPQALRASATLALPAEFRRTADPRRPGPAPRRPLSPGRLTPLLSARASRFCPSSCRSLALLWSFFYLLFFHTLSLLGLLTPVHTCTTQLLLTLKALPCCGERLQLSAGSLCCGGSERPTAALREVPLTALPARPQLQDARPGAAARSSLLDGDAELQLLLRGDHDSLEKAAALEYDYETIRNIDCYNTDFCMRVREGMRYWNMTVQWWLAQYIYKSAPARSYVLRSTWTLLLSAYWHGLHPGYYLSFLTMPLCLAAEGCLESALRGWLSPRGQKAWYWVHWFLKMCAYEYMCMGFELLSVDDILRCLPERVKDIILQSCQERSPLLTGCQLPVLSLRHWPPLPTLHPAPVSDTHILTLEGEEGAVVVQPPSQESRVLLCAPTSALQSVC